MGAPAIQAILDDAVAKGVAPGLTAAVAHADGTDSHYAAGVRGVADPTPTSPDDVFWIASCTKAITSAAALQLVERGALDLDAAVGERLPAFARTQVLDGFDGDGAPRLRPGRKPVTLRTLLTHTSGLAYDFFHADIGRYYAATGGALMTDAPAAPVLVFDPGDGWQYGISTDVVGWLVADVSGTLADHVAEHITGPLGMTDTAFDPTPAQAARRVGMHARDAEGAFTPSPVFPSSPVFHGGGGLTSTAPDYLKFLRAVMAPDGGGVFGPKTLNWLRDAESTLAGAGQLKTAWPPLSSDFDPMPGVAKTWTLGFLRNEADVPGMRRAGSLAWGGLANCYYWADPASGVAGMLCGQFLPFADPGMLGAFEAFERAAYAQ